MSILGPDGYMTSFQTQIESRSLVVDRNCHWGLGEEEPGLYCLEKFTKLRHLTWKGLYVRYQFNDLCGFFENNAQHLEYLELDFCGFGGYEENHLPDLLRAREEHGFSLTKYELLLVAKGLASYGRLFFFTMLAWYPQQITSPIYPALHSVTFSNMSFQRMGKILESVIDFGVLHSLKLHWCRALADLLANLPPTACMTAPANVTS